MDAMDIADERPCHSDDTPTPMDTSPTTDNDTLLSPPPATNPPTQYPVTPSTPTLLTGHSDVVIAHITDLATPNAPDTPAPMDTQIIDPSPSPYLTEDATPVTSPPAPTTPTPPPVSSPAANPNKRKSVVFDDTNTVRNGSTTSTVLAFNTPKCKKIMFVKVKLPMESKPKNPTDAARTKLKEFTEVLLKLDPSFIIYKYKQTTTSEYAKTGVAHILRAKYLRFFFVFTRFSISE
jgi:hypothetical protein